MLADLSVAQLQGLAECAFALIRKVNVEMGEQRMTCLACDMCDVVPCVVSLEVLVGGSAFANSALQANGQGNWSARERGLSDV